MEDGLRKLKIKKEFCRFSVDAETANFITKFTVSNCLEIKCNS